MGFRVVLMDWFDRNFALVVAVACVLAMSAVVAEFWYYGDL